MKFTQTFRVRFSECDANAQVTPIAVFNYLQDTAIAHSRSAGRGRELMEARGLAWMLNRAHLVFERFPAMDAELTITTWAHNLTGLYAVREWYIEDETGLCVRATARWILFNVQKKRIVKIPDDFSGSYGVEERRAVPDEWERMQPLEKDAVAHRDFHVRLSDLDTNRHANSGSYIDWLLEGAPDDTAQNATLTNLEITFKKESALGDGLRSGSAPRAGATADKLAYHHTIRGIDDDTVRAIGYTTWTPR